MRALEAARRAPARSRWWSTPTSPTSRGPRRRPTPTCTASGSGREPAMPHYGGSTTGCSRASRAGRAPAARPLRGRGDDDRPLARASCSTALHDLDLESQTVIALVSDHGILLGEHGWTGKISTALHPALTRVPLVVVDPPAAAPGRPAAGTPRPTTWPRRCCRWWACRRPSDERRGPVGAVRRTSRRPSATTPSAATATPSSSARAAGRCGAQQAGPLPPLRHAATRARATNVAHRAPAAWCAALRHRARRAGGRPPYYRGRGPGR